MIRRIARLLPVAAVATLIGCTDLITPVPPEAPAQPAQLDATAIQAIYALPHREDGTVMHGSHAGASWTKWTKSDGSLELLAGHGMFADTGKFVIRGNAVCSKWGIIDGGKEHCVHLARIGTDEYMTYGEDGVEGSRFKVTSSDK